MNFDKYNRQYLGDHSSDTENYQTLSHHGFATGVAWNVGIAKQILLDFEELRPTFADNGNELDVAFSYIASGNFAGAVEILKQYGTSSAKWLTEALQHGDDVAKPDPSLQAPFDVAPSTTGSLQQMSYGSDAFPAMLQLDQSSGVLFQKVSPKQDVAITSWTIYDSAEKAADVKVGSIVLDEEFNAICGQMAGAGVDAACTEQGAGPDGSHKHKWVVSNSKALELKAGGTYWFPIISDPAHPQFYTLASQDYRNMTNVCAIATGYNVRWCTHDIKELPVARMTLGTQDGKEYEL